MERTEHCRNALVRVSICSTAGNCLSTGSLMGRHCVAAAATLLPLLLLLHLLPASATAAAAAPAAGNVGGLKCRVNSAAAATAAAATAAPIIGSSSVPSALWQTNSGKGSTPPTPPPTANANDAAASTASGCSFCITFRNNLEGTDLLMCGAQLPASPSSSLSSPPLPPLQPDSSALLSDADSLLVGSSVGSTGGFDAAQLELMTARWVARLCWSSCGDAHERCAYTEAARQNLTDANGNLIDTVTYSNVTYRCCRGGDFCNTGGARGDAGSAMSVATGGPISLALTTSCCCLLLMELLPTV